MATPVVKISVTEFAELIGQTSQRVYQLIQKGLPHRKEKGLTKIVPREGVKWWVEYKTWELQENRKTRSDVPDEDDERALKMKAERQMKELDLKERSKQLVLATDFQEFTERVLSGLVAVVNGRVDRFERDMVAAKDIPQARRLIDRIKRALLEGVRSFGDQLDDEAAEMERVLADETARAAADTVDADPDGEHAT